MRAATIREKEIVIEEHPDPQAGAGEVLVRVHAAGLNGADMMQRRGLYPAPAGSPQDIPGMELAGEVAALGPGAERFKVGDRVMAIVGGGAQAELCLVHERQLMPVPEGLDWPAAGGLPEVFATAHDAIFTQGELRSGERLLVHGGAGGVGTAAIQLGMAAGAKVIATAGGPRKVEVCRELGADHVIDYTADDFVPIVKEITAGHGADVIYDPVGGDVFDKSRRCIAFEGRLVVVGFTSGRIPEAPANHLLVKNYSVVGLHWGLYRKHDPAVFGQVHEQLARLVEEGAVDPLVGEVLPLDQAPQALAKLADRSTVGKVVLVP
jgi:NADPH2:quinone reductase